MSIPFLAGALAGRYRSGRWRFLVVGSLMPVLLSLEVSCWWQNQKSFGPWKAHQQELTELRDNATAAARRIGLPASGMFNAEQIARLEREAPVKWVGD